MNNLNKDTKWEKKTNKTKLYQIIKSGTEIKDKEKKAPKCLARFYRWWQISIQENYI